jgi:Na+/H+-translocating membrane pyrophosphatase
MGLGVTGLAVIGRFALHCFHIFMPRPVTITNCLLRSMLTGLPLGAESIALFARVGGVHQSSGVGATVVKQEWKMTLVTLQPLQITWEITSVMLRAWVPRA